MIARFLLQVIGASHAIHDKSVKIVKLTAITWKAKSILKAAAVDVEDQQTQQQHDPELVHRVAEVYSSAAMYASRNSAASSCLTRSHLCGDLASAYWRILRCELKPETRVEVEWPTNPGRDDSADFSVALDT